MDVKYMLVEFMTVNFGQVSMSLQPFVCVCVPFKSFRYSYNLQRPTSACLPFATKLRR